MHIYLLRHAVAVEEAETIQGAPAALLAKQNGGAEKQAVDEVQTTEAAAAQGPAVTAPVPRKGTTVGTSDADRPLTKDGRKKMTNAANGIVRLLPAPIDVILTSPHARAKETAHITADAMGVKNKVRICPELSPGTPVPKLLRALAKYKTREHIMLVGHSPDLNAVASALLGTDALSVTLKKGSLCCIEKTSLSGRAKGTLVWLLQPKQLRQLAK